MFIGLEAELSSIHRQAIELASKCAVSFSLLGELFDRTNSCDDNSPAASIVIMSRVSRKNSHFPPQSDLMLKAEVLAQFFSNFPHQTGLRCASDLRFLLIFAACRCGDGGVERVRNSIYEIGGDNKIIN